MTLSNSMLWRGVSSSNVSKLGDETIEYSFDMDVSLVPLDNSTPCPAIIIRVGLPRSLVRIVTVVFYYSIHNNNVIKTLNNNFTNLRVKLVVVCRIRNLLFQLQPPKVSGLPIQVFLSVQAREYSLKSLTMSIRPTPAANIMAVLPCLSFNSILA